MLAWFGSICPLRGKSHYKSIQISILIGVVSLKIILLPSMGYMGSVNDLMRIRKKKEDVKPIAVWPFQSLALKPVVTEKLW